MESSFVDSTLELVHVNSKPKSSKSTLVDTRVESSNNYSKPKLFMVESKLEFVVEQKFPIDLSKRWNLVEL